MVCYHPLQGYRSRVVNSSGKRSVVFNPRDGFQDLKLEVACGQCIGCRLEKSRQWAVRCSHEASLHLKNSFITLTYADEFLPITESGLPTLVLKHMQDFMKRLKKPVPYEIKQFYVGEYGSRTFRPHYHVLLFGYDFEDKKIWSNNYGNPLYTSDILSKLWPFGFSSIGSVTFDSAGYVARYSLKKIGKKSEDYLLHYGDRVPEFCQMSRRPGIATEWFKKYYSDVYPSDFVVIGKRKQKPPSFYDKKLELLDPTLYLDIKLNRKKFALSLKNRKNSTYERLLVRKEVKLSSISQLGRPLE